MVETITKGMQNELENATSQNTAASSPMTESDLFAVIKEKAYVEAGSEAHKLMHEIAMNARRITMEMNTKFHTNEELNELFSELIGEKVDPSFGIFPPFFQVVFHVGKPNCNTFIPFISLEPSLDCQWLPSWPDMILGLSFSLVLHSSPLYLPVPSWLLCLSLS